MLKILRLLTLLILPLILTSACSTIASDVPFVYEIDVDQGNVVDQDMVNQLRAGMTKRQIIYIMGSPLVIDSFNIDRWDYIYSVHPGSEDRALKRIALFFTSNKLAHVDGHFSPQANPAPTPSKEVTIEAPKRKIDKTLYEIITGWFTFED